VNSGGVLLISSDFDERALASAALASVASRVFEADPEEDLDTLIQREAVAVAIVIEQLREDPVLEWACAALERHRTLQLIVVFDSDVLDQRRALLDADPRTVVMAKPVDAARLTYHVAAMLASEPEQASLDVGSEARVHERVLELQREFGRELPARLQKLALVLGSARHEPAAAAEAAMLAHRLRGSAAAYGFAGLGQAAGELEDVLNKRASTPLSRGDFAQIELALSDMIAGAQSAPRSLLSEAPARSYLGLSPLLVLDDDAEFVRRVRSIARSQFLDAIVARHPRAALAHARRTPPIGALVGERFEGEFSGLCEKLRKVSGQLDLPIVLAVARVEPQAQRMLGDLRRVLVVSRGASDAELTETLRKLAFTRSAERQRALLLGDDETYAHELRALAATLDVELRCLTQAERTLEVLEEYAPHLLLVDLCEHVESGLDVCRMLRRSARFQHLQVVLVNAREDVEARLSAYRAGATDCFTKQLPAEELQARVALRLALARACEAHAEKDALTGLLNLRPFLEAGERMLARARRAVDPVAVALLDLDGLSALNARHGHLPADDAIAQLGRLVRERFRVSDLRCRWAGGQFAVLFDGADKLDILGALQRLLADFRACRFQGGDGTSFEATASAGVAAFPADGESLHALLTRADQRLCRAKQAGGARLCGADTSGAPAEFS
jgi:diguanylate cyclase (GGDEF)-like protein